MMGLVDYGSNSDSEPDDTPEDIVAPIPEVAPHVAPPTASSKKGPEDSYFGADDIFEGSNSLNLPSVIEPASSVTIREDDVLEEMVKPKEWEIKMAEKERRRLEKKAKKKEKKEKRRKEKATKKVIPNGDAKAVKGKAKIAAFGALSAIAGQSSDESDDEKAKQPALPSKTKGSGLLAMLPDPKSGRAKGDLGGAKKSGIMLPPSLRNKAGTASVKASSGTTQAVKRSAASDDSDDDDLPTDFFGLSSAPEAKVPRVGDVPAMIGGVADVVGPSRPERQEIDDDEMYGYPEEAHRLIMKHEIMPGGPMDNRSFNTVAADIVDIRVDDALGPDVKATLLKNLHVAARAKDAMAPLPKSKNPADAVAREEALQQQWAESKQMRRMGRQKYGF
ncbi:unnamed protein product [Nippostrongylus brasiliensis]|uniref:Proline-rich protein PRCC n=1 Tax=Nippostrongylus brasiliensis TaxID=27835 RepID=A0A0N4XI84_NIPBR|nr:unnamed protein product [Nippostrongylus brasiliensis]